MKFLIRADATRKMGVGHVLRCLALAQELIDKDFEVERNLLGTLLKDSIGCLIPSDKSFCTVSILLTMTDTDANKIGNINAVNNINIIRTISIIEPIIIMSLRISSEHLHFSLTKYLV